MFLFQRKHPISFITKTYERAAVGLLFVEVLIWRFGDLKIGRLGDWEIGRVVELLI